MQDGNTDFEIELPLINVKEENILDVLMTYHDYSESLKDGVLKIETWIMNFAEEQIAPLRESGEFTEEEIEAMKKKMCVISPLTLTLYTHWIQMEQYINLPDSEKESMLLAKVPDRFKARYKGNASNRQARETTADEEMANADKEPTDSAEEVKRRQSMTFPEFLKKIGEEIRTAINSNNGKAA